MFIVPKGCVLRSKGSRKRQFAKHHGQFLTWYLLFSCVDCHMMLTQLRLRGFSMVPWHTSLYRVNCRVFLFYMSTQQAHYCLDSWTIVTAFSSFVWLHLLQGKKTFLLKNSVCWGCVPRILIFCFCNSLTKSKLLEGFGWSSERQDFWLGNTTETVQLTRVLPLFAVGNPPRLKKPNDISD